jgi:serine phosphatase RsbU (regulator of sigma subunit)/lipopolysaccharide biosynthesis regulator YciM
MKKIFHILSLVAFCLFANCLLPITCCFSQTISDLEQKLKTATTEEKPSILNQLAEAYLKTDANKTIDYAEQALKAARKLDDVDSETGALISLGNGYDVLKNQKKALLNYKEAIRIFDEYNQPASSAAVWSKIADSYLAAQKYDEALDADNQALDLFKKARDNNGIVNTNIEIGDIYFKQKKFESSLPSYKAALKMYEDSKDAHGQVTILSRIGTSYSEWGNYDEAYVFLNHALDVAKKNNLSSQVASISENIEGVKKNLSNWQKSKTEYDVKAQQEQQEKTHLQELQIKTKETEISSLATKNIKSMAEIEQLSAEAQLKEFKIKAQQEERNRLLMEAQAQAKANEYLKKEKELSDSELNKKNLIIWGGIGFSVLGLILTLLVFVAYRNKKKANDIQKQKNDIIYKQKEQIEQKNMLITDSIDYAKNIQDAILPPASMLAKHFSDSFVFYKPKDIVSGDFFWIHEGKENDCVCVAAADCTGHGVPGAFMSLLGFIMLDDMARRNAQVTPADILKEVNTQLMSMLHQNTENTTGKFGMDISLIKFDKQKKEITFSGAHNPLIIVNRDGQINEIKADRVSIGTTLNCFFTNHTVQVKEGDMVYLYSDGYQDQIGGEKRKKFLSFHLKELIQQIHALDAEKQKEELNSKHMEWRSKTDQTDDILIIGLKI